MFKHIKENQITGRFFVFRFLLSKQKTENGSFPDFGFLISKRKSVGRTRTPLLPTPPTLKWIAFNLTASRALMNIRYTEMTSVTSKWLPFQQESSHTHKWNTLTSLLCTSHTDQWKWNMYRIVVSAVFFFQTKQKFLYTVPVKSLDTPSHFLRRFFFDFIILYMVDKTFFV